MSFESIGNQHIQQQQQSPNQPQSFIPYNSKSSVNNSNGIKINSNGSESSSQFSSPSVSTALNGGALVQSNELQMRKSNQVGIKINYQENLVGSL